MANYRNAEEYNDEEKKNEQDDDRLIVVVHSYCYCANKSMSFCMHCTSNCRAETHMLWNIMENRGGKMRTNKFCCIYLFMFKQCINRRQLSQLLK